VFFIASIYFWGRLFAGTPLKMQWLLLVTMAIAGLPVILKSDAAVFMCVLLTMLLITLDGFVLAKRKKHRLRDRNTRAFLLHGIQIKPTEIRSS
jgi:hypothetical protein